jgi:hypothetical protein
MPDPGHSLPTGTLQRLVDLTQARRHELRETVAVACPEVANKDEAYAAVLAFCLMETIHAATPDDKAKIIAAANSTLQFEFLMLRPIG